MIAIILTSLKLALDTYADPDDKSLMEAGYLIDIFITNFFSVEMILKTIAFGFMFDQNSYLRDDWSKMDCLIVFISIIDLAFDNISLQFVKIFRLLRTLRPLRFISHNKSMKTIVTALLESSSGIFNVLIVVILIWIMFGILGMSLMKDKMKYC